MHTTHRGEALIERLHGATARGSGQYLARCPAHDDRSPSLSVRLCEDGSTIVHCFAGCTAFDVVAAVGLTIHHLFPDDGQRQRLPKRLRLTLDSALRAIAYETRVVRLCAGVLASGRGLAEDERARLEQAAEKILSIENAVY